MSRRNPRCTSFTPRRGTCPLRYVPFATFCSNCSPIGVSTCASDRLLLGGCGNGTPHHRVTMCSVGSTWGMKRGASTFLRNATHSDCGERRSQKGRGSHGQDTSGGRDRASDER